MNTKEKVEIRDRAKKLIKKNKSAEMRLRIILAIFVVVLISLFVNVYKEQEQLLSSKNAENEKLKQCIKVETENKQELSDMKANLDSKDTAAFKEMIEKLAREQFDMVRPGERVFVDVNR